MRWLCFGGTPSVDDVASVPSARPVGATTPWERPASGSTLDDKPGFDDDGEKQSTSARLSELRGLMTDEKVDY